MFYREGKLLLSSPLSFLAGQIITLTYSKLTGKKQIISYVWELIKLWCSKKWPKQEAFISFRQRNNKFVKNWQVWTWGSMLVRNKVCTYSLKFHISGDMNTFYPPGIGRAPFTWEIYYLLPAGKGRVRVSFLYQLLLK